MRWDTFEEQGRSPGMSPSVGSLLPPGSEHRACSAGSTALVQRSPRPRRLNRGTGDFEAAEHILLASAEGAQRGFAGIRRLASAWTQATAGLWSSGGTFGKVAAVLSAALGIATLGTVAYVVVLILPFLLLVAFVAAAFGIYARMRTP